MLKKINKEVEDVLIICKDLAQKNSKIMDNQEINDYKINPHIKRLRMFSSYARMSHKNKYIKLRITKKSMITNFNSPP